MLGKKTSRKESKTFSDFDEIVKRHQEELKKYQDEIKELNLKIAAFSSNDALSQLYCRIQKMEQDHFKQLKQKDIEISRLRKCVYEAKFEVSTLEIKLNKVEEENYSLKKYKDTESVDKSKLMLEIDSLKIQLENSRGSSNFYDKLRFDQAALIKKQTDTITELQTSLKFHENWIEKYVDSKLVDELKSKKFMVN